VSINIDLAIMPPVIAKVLEEDEDFKADIKEMIDGILPIIR